MAGEMEKRIGQILRIASRSGNQPELIELLPLVFKKFLETLGPPEGWEETLRELERGRLRFSLHEVFEPFFDQAGRLLWRSWFGGRVCLSGKLVFQAPKMGSLADFTRRLERLEATFDLALREGTVGLEITPKEYLVNTQELIGELKKDEQLMNILGGPCFPVLFPRMFVSDPGYVLEQLVCGLLKRATSGRFASSYAKRFWGKRLAQSIVTDDVSQCRKLYTRMGKSVVSALFFPAAMRSYSVEAARGAMTLLGSHGFVLPGAVLQGLVVCTFPDDLLSEFTPYLDCAADAWLKHDDIICFRKYVNDERCWLDARPSYPVANSSIGLIYIGDT